MNKILNFKIALCDIYLGRKYRKFWLQKEWKFKSDAKCVGGNNGKCPKR